MKEFNLGQIIYYLETDRNGMRIRSGRIYKMTEFTKWFTTKKHIYTFSYEDCIETEDAFDSKECLINSLIEKLNGMRDES